MTRAGNLSTIRGPVRAPARGSLRDGQRQSREHIHGPQMLALNESIAGWAKETSTFRSDAVPVPLEHLGNDSWEAGCQSASVDGQVLPTVARGRVALCMGHGVREGDQRED